MSEMLDIYRVSERYGVNKDTIRRWIKSGDFPEPIRVGKKLLRWDVVDLAAYDNERKGTQA